MSTPDPDLVEKERLAPEKATDFQALTANDDRVGPRTPPKTLVDSIVDISTPLLIFVMCYAVMYFLLNVRYIYTEVNDLSFRWVTFCFLVGIVASNRILARDSTPEGFLLPIIFGGTVGLYTLTIPGSSLVPDYLGGNPWSTAGFNVTVVVIIWWVVNRLTHECCVDENKTAGEVGILTGTARKLQQRIRPRQEDALAAHLYDNESHAQFAASQGKEFMPMNVMEAFDPSEGFKPKGKPKPKYNLDFSQRLSDRHPGVSILYFSVPVMVIFTMGARVLQQGGDGMILTGHIYVGVYTVAALLLLLLTSLAGIRQYFRARLIAMPTPMGYFWVGLGVTMLGMVLLAAMRLPKPEMPPMASVIEHQTDYWTRGSTFRLASAAAEPIEILRHNRMVEYIGNGVLVLFGLFGVYVLFNLALQGTGWVGRHRHRFPPFVGRFFARLERLLTLLTHVPALPRFSRLPRIQRSIATCSAYESSLGRTDGGMVAPADHVAHAYEALCALAYDMGVPRGTDQTPNEFIDAFPKPLRKLKQEARELTRLYVQSSYSQQPLAEDTEQAVRRFWVAYNQARRRVLR